MNPKHFSKLALSLCVAAGSTLLAGGALAQEDLTDLGLEEMVVTAQKREENLQAVPISISALSAHRHRTSRRAQLRGPGQRHAEHGWLRLARLQG